MHFAGATPAHLIGSLLRSPIKSREGIATGDAVLGLQRIALRHVGLRSEPFGLRLESAIAASSAAFNSFNCLQPRAVALG